MKLDITRAWKDELYRQSLSEEELLTLPESPVGGLDLSDDILDTVYGGREHHHFREHRHFRHHHDHDDSESDSDSESDD